MRTLLCLFLFMLIMACANTRPMKQRLIPRNERIAYIDKHGNKYGDVIREEFTEGKLIFGMPQKLIVVLYGKPNKVFYNNTIWHYTDKWGDSILKICFDEFGKIELFEFNKQY